MLYGDKKLLLRATSVLCLLIPQEAAKSAAASVAARFDIDRDGKLKEQLTFLD